MNTMLRNTLIALALPALSLPAFASDKDCTTEPKEKWQTQKQVQAGLEQQGYTVKRIKREGSCYEAKVTGNDGRKAELIINPADGQVVDEEDKS